VVRLDKEDKKLLKNQRSLLYSIPWVKNMTFLVQHHSSLIERSTSSFIRPNFDHSFIHSSFDLHLRFSFFFFCRVLHNLLYVTYLFGDFHFAAVQLIWKTIAMREENVAQVIDFVITFGTNIRNEGERNLFLHKCSYHSYF
jgi:hypothetical protein